MGATAAAAAAGRQRRHCCLRPPHPPPRCRPPAPPPAEKELSRHRAALSGAIAERDSLREDLGEVREAKRRAELGYKQQLERATALDKELAFYQAQSARVMADRDRAVWEGEELKAQNLQVRERATSGA